MPRKTPLKKGDRIQFLALNTSLPNEDEYSKPRLIDLYSEGLSFKMLTGLTDAGVQSP